jgi:preprotein translocase subunit SecE
MSSTSRTVDQAQALQDRLKRGFYFLATLVAAVFYTKLVAAIFSALSIKDMALLGRGFTLSTAYALGLTALTMWYALTAPRARLFIDEVAQELVKVSWPTFDESKLQTFQTAVTTTIIAVILYTFDFVFGGLTSLLLSF